MSNLPTGTVTFLFTDIEGSTKLSQQYPEELPRLVLRHNEILHQAIDAHNGYVFQTTGDSFAVAFHSAEDALHAALAAQRMLRDEVWSPAPVKIRMGIHTGTAQLLESSELRYSGYAAIAMTQRIMSAGHGGQILISQIVQDLLKNKLPEKVSLRDMGKHRLKDVVSLEQLFQVDTPDLPPEFPALKTLSIQLNNLPMQLTPFIGRDREVTALLGLLGKSDVRLVTLTGAGGTGKTRLSLQVAADLLDEYEHGVWFVELASITDPELFLPTVASTLKVKETAGKPIGDTLNEYLADKQLLLVLDNFEQIVSAAPQITGLLKDAPKVKVLVSSREVLRLRGEHDYPVPPLGLPESKRKQTAAVLAQYEAIALFTQHAQAVNTSFELNEDNANIVAEICMKLDGLPLAIELAAARSRMLKPAAMLEKLKNKLDTLTGGARDLPRRQQTIRGAIDWSHALLEETEKKLFARLGIFVGGWTLEAAESVCGSSLDALGGIESLLDKSLVRQYEGISGETRFTMLETIREYAREKLSQSGELEAIQQAHADYMEQFLQNTINGSHGPEEIGLFAKLDDDLDNLRSVVERALTRQQPAVVFKIGWLFEYWNTRVNYHEPLGWLERALVMEDDSAQIDRARAMRCAGNFMYQFNNTQRARAYHESALVLYRELGDTEGIAACLNNLGLVARQEKHYEEARQFYLQAMEYQQPVSWVRSILLNNLGGLAMDLGDYQEAWEPLLRSREICEQLGAETGVAYADYLLGKVAVRLRKLDEARGYFQSALKSNWLSSNPLRSRVVISNLGYIELLSGSREEAKRLLNDSLEAALEFLGQSSILFDLNEGWALLDGKARLELLDGHPERAARLFGAAWVVGGGHIAEAEHPDYEARIAELRAGMGDAAFDAAFQKGQAMSLKDAVAFALEKSSE